MCDANMHLNHAHLHRAVASREALAGSSCLPLNFQPSVADCRLHCRLCMDTLEEKAPRFADQAAQRDAVLHRARAALTAWLQQQPDTGPNIITAIQAQQAVQFLLWYTRQPAYRRAQLPDSTAIVAPGSLHAVSLRCASIWSTDRGIAVARGDTRDEADSDISISSLDSDTDGNEGSVETPNPFRSVEVRSLCAEYAMGIGRLGFLPKGAPFLPGLT